MLSTYDWQSTIKIVPTEREDGNIVLHYFHIATSGADFSWFGKRLHAAACHIQKQRTTASWTRVRLTRDGVRRLNPQALLFLQAAVPGVVGTGRKRAGRLHVPELDVNRVLLEPDNQLREHGALRSRIPKPNRIDEAVVGIVCKETQHGPDKDVNRIVEAACGNCPPTE